MPIVYTVTVEEQGIVFSQNGRVVQVLVAPSDKTGEDLMEAILYIDPDAVRTLLDAN